MEHELSAMTGSLIGRVQTQRITTAAGEERNRLLESMELELRLMGLTTELLFEYLRSRHRAA